MNRQALGRLVKERRLKLGFARQTDFARAAGIKSRTTIAAVENGRSVKGWTLDMIDSALGWRVRSCRKFLADGTLPVFAEDGPEYTDPSERGIWAITDIPEERRLAWIEELRQVRRQRVNAAAPDDGSSTAREVS